MRVECPIKQIRFFIQYTNTISLCSSNSSLMARVTKVRRRVVKRTPRANAQKAAFLKGKSCVFKMAPELYSVRGVQAAMISLSSDGKAFLVCHPCANTIAHMVGDRDAMAGLVQAQHGSVESALIQQIKDARDLLDAVKNHVKESLEMTVEMMRESMCQHFLGKPFDELNLIEINQMKAKIEELIRKKKESIQSAARSAAKSVGA